jgi:spore maturation protein CgeB
MFLEGLRIGMACVNLPTLVKSFSGRVIEAMAAGVPSVSWLPPNRGSCEKLFSDGKDLLLFNTIEELIDKLMLLRQQPQLKTTLVNSARNILLERHTSKIRCAQYAAWLDNASSPTF